MSTVDYFLLEYSDFMIIKDFDIMPVSEFSDHCALAIYLERKTSPIDFSANPAPELYLAWEDTKIDTFRNKLLDNINTLHHLTENVNIHWWISQLFHYV